MRQAECSRIYAERNHVGKLAGATAQYMWPSGQIYEEAVSQLKQAEFHGIFGKRSAAEYMKSENHSENHVGKLTGDAAQYMWRVSDKYTKKPT